MNTEELKKLAMAATPGPWAYSNDSKDFPVNGYVTVRDCIYSVCVLPYEGIRTDDRVTDNGLFIAAANPAAILALIAEIARFTQDAEMAAASLNLLTGHHEHLLAEFDRVTKERDEAIAKLERAQAEIRALESKMLEREVQS